MEEEAIFATHHPNGWDQMQHYVVICQRTQGGQFLLVPRYTVILVPRNDLPLEELVHRHRGKQDHENAFKGPLVDMDLHHPSCRGYRAKCEPRHASPDQRASGACALQNGHLVQ